MNDFSKFSTYCYINFQHISDNLFSENLATLNIFFTKPIKKYLQCFIFLFRISMFYSIEQTSSWGVDYVFHTFIHSIVVIFFMKNLPFARGKKKFFLLGFYLNSQIFFVLISRITEMFSHILWRKYKQIFFYSKETLEALVPEGSFFCYCNWILRFF